MTERTQVVEYTIGNETITITPDDVRNYLVSGNGDVTMKEIMVFMQLCKNAGLNPWAKEVYCIKYGNSPATMVVAKEAYLKRAEASPNYDGMLSGIVVQTADGLLEHREGTLALGGEKLVGGWAEVFRKDRSHSTRVEVSFREYVQTTYNKTTGKQEPNSQWAKKPGTMIRKVAMVQALREAFPAEFGGMYTAEEQNQAETTAEVLVEAEVKEDPFKAKAKAIENHMEEKPVEKPVEEEQQMSLEDIDMTA